jgi:hypothetical protein
MFIFLLSEESPILKLFTKLRIMDFFVLLDED